MNRNDAQAYRALTKIARREGIPVEQVISEIEKAIRAAYLSAQNSGDQAALERWAEIPCEGNLPTALELITYLGDKVRKWGLS